MNLEQLGKLPGAVYESNCKQAFRSAVPPSISSEKGVLCKFSTPRDDCRDESGMEGIRLGVSTVGTDITGTDQMAIGYKETDRNRSRKSSGFRSGKRTWTI